VGVSGFLADPAAGQPAAWPAPGRGDRALSDQAVRLAAVPPVVALAAVQVTQAADGNSGEIFDGTVSGDDVAWKISITNPMPLTLAFTGKVSGDSISGEMGIGPMGSFPFTGKRA